MKTKQELELELLEDELNKILISANHPPENDDHQTEALIVFNFLTEKVKQGYDICLYNLGLCYFNGAGTNRNIQTGISYIFDAAEKNNPLAAFFLAKKYFEGTELEQNLGLAFKYCEKAANNKHPEAQFLLAQWHFKGIGTQQNLILAFNMFNDLYSSLNIAAYELGFCYERGLGVNQDILMAVHYYEKAAGQYDARAMHILGYLYENGFGVPKELETALKYYKLSCKYNNPQSYCNLGAMILSQALEEEEKETTSKEKNTILEKFQQSVTYFNKAIELGYLTAYNNLGYCFEVGLGIQKNTKKALQCYYIGAQQGNTQNLASCFFEGTLGVIGDPNRALILFQNNNGALDETNNIRLKTCYDLLSSLSPREALEDYNFYCFSGARNGDLIAKSILAFSYMLGLGTKQEINSAIKIFIELILHDYKNKTHYFSQCYYDIWLCYKLFDNNLNKIQTIINFYNRYSEFDAIANKVLAEIYEEGDYDLPIDLYKSQSHFQKAHELNPDNLEIKERLNEYEPLIAYKNYLFEHSKDFSIGLPDGVCRLISWYAFTPSR